MSAANLRFQVDSRLATLLSQEYRSTERALKELVDNAWDADADQVSIQLPKPLSGEPIVIRDDGTGMTEEELRRHYLTIAKDRRSARGERTAGKNRQVELAGMQPREQVFFAVVQRHASGLAGDQRGQFLASDGMPCGEARVQSPRVRILVASIEPGCS